MPTNITIQFSVSQCVRVKILSFHSLLHQPVSIQTRSCGVHRCGTMSLYYTFAETGIFLFCEIV